MDRDQIIRAIQHAARTLGVERLSIPAFRRESGISQAAVLKHFDIWSDACAAAGINCGQTRENLIPTPRVSEEECISELHRVSKVLGRKALSSKEFSQHARFTSKPVIERFGSWQNAIARAGLELCEQSKREIQLSEGECVQELQRVANLLGTTSLSRDTFNTHTRFSAYRVSRACGGWVAALKKAGLNLSPNYKHELPLAQLATVFRQVVTDLNRVPTLVQLVRRSKHAADTFSRNRGGYSAFKRDAIEYLFSTRIKMPRETRSILNEELARLPSGVPTQPDPVTVWRPHYQGRTLNFRAFTYAPTCEHDVVQMFGAVAAELGFEIIGNRSAFPDCEARRKVAAVRERWEKCLIEYEFSSSDYKNHKHPLEGCDLIVCWQHNWSDCPIEVLVLEEAIRELDGWK